jgi:DDE superfamily endonuclease
VAALLDARHTAAIRRSSIWRILHDIELKPDNSAYWLPSHDEAVDAQAHPICQLYARARAAYQQGRLVVCCDEKTGRQVLARTPPTKPAQPGRRERREHADLRHGTRGLLNPLAVATGQMAWTSGRTRNAPDCVAHLQPAYQRLPRMKRYAWVLDHLHTHWSLDVGRLVARGCKVPFEPSKRKQGPQRRAFLSDPSHPHGLHCTPKHGSWLHQAEWCFGVLPRRCLARGSFPGVKDFTRRLERFWHDDNARHAHPYRWTYTGQP